MAVLAVTGLLLYGLTLRGVPGNIPVSAIKGNLDQATEPLELSPERGRYAMIVSLAEDHSFALRKELGLMVYPDVGYYRGKFFSFFAPGVSILALPFYLLGYGFNLSQVASYATVSLFAVMNLILIFIICRSVLRLPDWTGLAAALIFGFGCSAWSYAITLYQHHVTVFLMLSAFLAAWKFRSNGRFGFFWAAYVWLSYAYAIFIDYPNAILLSPVMVYFAQGAFRLVKDYRRHDYILSLRPVLFLSSLVFAAGMTLHGYYNSVNFGDWKRLSGGLPSYKTIVEMKLEGQANPDQIIISKLGEKNVVGFFREERLPNGFAVLTVSADRGLFLYAPVFLVALFGMALAVRKRTPELLALLSSVIVNVFLYSSWGDPWGGWAFGPRYLIPSMAVLSIFIATVLARAEYSRTARFIVWPLFLISASISLLGALTTNAVPPQSEAAVLHTEYNFLHNLKFFWDGRSGSFVYNTYLSGLLTLPVLFVVIYVFLSVLMFTTLFILPARTNRHDD